MPDDPKVLTLRRPTLQPSESERTITVSYEHFLLLLDAFVDCAGALQRSTSSSYWTICMPCSRATMRSGRGRCSLRTRTSKRRSRRC